MCSSSFEALKLASARRVLQFSGVAHQSSEVYEVLRHALATPPPRFEDTYLLSTVLFSLEIESKQNIVTFGDVLRFGEFGPISAVEDLLSRHLQHCVD
eukprot:6490497-Amphidinium_carterae.2